MQEVTKYPPGTFSWVDLSTTDAEGAKTFYSQLFGWGTHDIPIGPDSFYTMFQLEGRDVAAASEMAAEMKAQGHPAHWISYISVEDVDDVTSRVEGLGGTVIAPPFDVFDSGRMAVIQDPTQAAVALWQAKSHIGAKLVNIPGAFSWNELATNDLNQATEFYTNLIGWEINAMEMGGGLTYHTISNKGRMNGGMMQMNEEWGDAPPHWMVYFSVADCDASAKKAESLGGTIMVPPSDIPTIGSRFAVIQDPQGAVFTIMYSPQVDGPPG